MTLGVASEHQAIYSSRHETTRSNLRIWGRPRVGKSVGWPGCRNAHPFLLPSCPILTPHLAGFWLPLLARTVATVTRVTDYNIVQNNGARAAQVVPHVHFHIIPRPESMPRIQNKSWTMFGRGQRDDLDEEEGVQMAGEMRRVLRGVVEGLGARDRGARL